MVSSSSPPQSHSQDKLPWSLACICWLCLLSGVVPAAVLWRINNRRLGISPPILTRIFVWASLALYVLALVRLLLIEEGSLQMQRLQLVGLVMTLVLAWQFYSSQRVPFARYCKAGGRTAALKWPIVSGVIWVFILACLQIGVEAVHTERDYKKFDIFAASLSKSTSNNREAELFFQEFKRKYPEETMTHWNLAIIYAQTDRVEQAKAEIQELLQAEPNNKEAHDYLNELQQY
ncbi:hypothetical protein IAD21_00375 [Abditibacteriota bacterium]|nr:hypothetical protein IAD21_00375 [Abditibacteriota bacterium]